MTKLIRYTFVLAIVAVAGQAHAQELKVITENHDDSIVQEMPSLGNATPEMWFYLQELRRYEDPAAAQRRRAELTAAARRSRIMARQWYGISNLRPSANPVPWMYRYSNHQSNRSWDTVQDTYFRSAATPAYGGPRQF